MSMRSSVIMLTALLSASAGYSADWPMYRGNPGRTAVSPETGLLQEWPEDGPPLVWKKEGIRGTRSSPVVAGGIVYTRAAHMGFLALDARTGEVVWTVKTHGHGDSTPTVVGDRIVLNAGGYGTYSCLSTNDGRPLWRFDIRGVVPSCRKWGCRYGSFAQSPLVVSNTVIVETGDPDVPVLGVSLKDGSLVWKATPRPEKKMRYRCYASPVFCQRGETPLVISHFATGIAGLDARDGSVLWERKLYERKNLNQCPIGNCAQVDGDVLIMSTASMSLRPNALALSGDGTSVSNAWHNESRINPYQEGTLIHKGLAYGTGRITWTQAMTTEGLLINGKPYADIADRIKLPHQQSQRDKQYFRQPDTRAAPLVCLDAQTGKVLGVSFDVPHGGRGGWTGHILLAADDRIIAVGTSEQRKAYLLEPGPAMKIVGSVDLPPGKSYDKHGNVRNESSYGGRWSSPALADGLLYVRLNDILVAYDLRKPGE